MHKTVDALSGVSTKDIIVPSPRTFQKGMESYLDFPDDWGALLAF